MPFTNYTIIQNQNCKVYEKSSRAKVCLASAILMQSNSKRNMFSIYEIVKSDNRSQ